MVTDPLDNATTYTWPTKKEVFSRLSRVDGLIECFVGKWKDERPEAEHMYLKGGLKQDQNGMTRFYTMIKIDKDGSVFWPIVAICGNIFSITTVWLDHKLKQLLLWIKTYINISSELREKLKEGCVHRGSPLTAQLLRSACPPSAIANM